MNRRKKRQSGQALILVTLALIAMAGMLGLAVDLGWSYFTKKSEQAAADTAALAAVSAAQRNGTKPYGCGTGAGQLWCNSTPTPCSGNSSVSASSNAYSACQYAAQNGFTDGADNVSVTVAANFCPTTCEAPTAPGVKVYYWVTVRVNRQIPQLFSAVLGNTTALVSARATAALTNVVFNASLDLLNRQNDPNPVLGTGVDMAQQGGGNIQSPGGMFLASTLAGAAQFGGSSSVTNTPFSYFRGSGTCVENNGGNCQNHWTQNWKNSSNGGPTGGAAFEDPTASRNNPDQPSLSTSVMTDQIVNTNVNKGKLGPNNPPGVTGTGVAGDPYILPPGNYYMANCQNNQCVPTGGQIPFDNAYYSFGQGTSFTPGQQWVFYGGLTTTGGNATITFTPGRYIFAGTTNQNPSFYVDNGTTINDTYVNNSSYPGEIFLYTKPGYNTTSQSLTTPSALSNITFDFGEAGFKAGNSNNSSFSLHGLDPVNSPSDLQDWAPFLMWQDRGDSPVIYYPHTGQIEYAINGLCVSGAAETGSGTGEDIACTHAPTNPNGPQMDLQATPSTALQGAVYQPRGGWLNMQGGGSISGNLQIVTGALNNGGSGTVVLQGLSNPITILTTALIE